MNYAVKNWVLNNTPYFDETHPGGARLATPRGCKTTKELLYYNTWRVWPRSQAPSSACTLRLTFDSRPLPLAQCYIHNCNSIAHSHMSRCASNRVFTRRRMHSIFGERERANWGRVSTSTCAASLVSAASQSCEASSRSTFSAI